MLKNQLLATNADIEEEQFATIQEHIPMEWIEEVLQQEGFAKLRRRRLPVEQVVWLILGMAIFRKRSIAEVVNKLDLALADGRQVTIAPSAIPKARRRVGSEPLRELFAKTGEHWAHAQAREHLWKGLALYAIDSTLLRVPDTEDNAEHFGIHRTGRRATQAGYPQARLTALMALRARIVAHACFGPHTDSELSHACEHLVHQIPDNSLTILDRLYVSSLALVPFMQQGTNRHFLVRLRTNSKYETLQELGKGDELVQVTVNWDAHQIDSTLPRSYRARAIVYETEEQTSVLLTSALDPKRYPADEIRALYHERWEIELGYDELKTDVLLHNQSLRSKTKDGIEQELWGLLLAYNLIRFEMAHIAQQADVCPNRISFVAALHLIRDEWLWCAVASPGAVPRHLKNLRQTLKLYILPPRRPQRRYARVVKIRDSKYPRKGSQSLTNSLK